MKLLIISHTEHFYGEDGRIYGLGPTVNEINHLSNLFDQVTHVGVMYKNQKPDAGYRRYNPSKIHFVPIPPYGGKGIRVKMRIFWLAPRIIRITLRELSRADIFHFRAPTSIGIYLIPLLTLITQKKGWYKYAGNWLQECPPFSYAVQRWWLRHLQGRKVTINGSGNSLPAHCMAFENPCLEDDDIEKGNQTRMNKTYQMPLTMCFAGRVEKAKGIHKLMEALIRHPHPEYFNTLHIIGEGPEKKQLEHLACKIPLKVVFHGSLSRNQVFQIYLESHLIILPSESEGFPKVLAEAANFGCIPVATNLPGIRHHISEKAGYLWNRDQESFFQFFSHLDLSKNTLNQKAEYIGAIARSFTYSRYMKRIEREILW